ncbi:TolB family protein [Streptomyces mirabilis]|jgi:Tol biopolymer transport system component|uniref:TolB family protein n=1 Tax=Streptomyces mirabilis TaxID=68239 RepID=UPI00167D39C9|nr:PD40 domain-containing protein [Streptomyces mirabilis]
MSARNRRNTAAVTTAGAAALLSLCGTAATAMAAPSSGGDAKGSAAMVAAAASAHTVTVPRGLTISDGTRHVVVNGKSIDFGTAVRDLAWNPNGSKAAFIDGHGDLVVSNPDGSHRVTVAANPGGQTWSHPTWQVTAADRTNQIPAKNNLIFSAKIHGSTVLEGVKATSNHGKPTKISLNGDPGDGNVPQTNNTWPNVGGSYGSAVYENTHTGEVYIRDDYLRQQGGALTKGSEPALSPDNEEVVFVRSVHGHDHLFVEDFGGSTNVVKDVTPNATADYTEPTWAPNGKTIAFRAPTGTYTITKTAHGFGKPVKVSKHTGLPAYRG